MNIITRTSLLGGTALVAILATSSLTMAPTTPQVPGPEDEATVDEIVVVGS